MLKYPPFATGDYACIASPLLAVNFFLRLEALESRKSELELSKERLEAKSKCSLVSVKESVLQDVASLIRECDGEERRKELGAMLPNLKTCLSRGSLTNDRRMAASEDILRLYARFDVDAFAADVDYFIQSSGDCEGLRDELQRLNGGIGRCTKDLNSLWEKLDAVFHEIPLNWRDYRFTSSLHESAERDAAIKQEKRRMGERILRTFIREWKERAPLFECAVTVNGVGLHTLPTHLGKQEHTEAYEKLGLGQIPKKIYYKFLVCREAERKPEDVSVPHPLFTEGGVSA